MAKLEGAYEQVDRRLGNIEQRLGHIEQRIESQFYWIVGLIIAGVVLPLIIQLFTNQS